MARSIQLVRRAPVELPPGPRSHQPDEHGVCSLQRDLPQSRWSFVCFLPALKNASSCCRPVRCIFPQSQRFGPGCSCLQPCRGSLLSPPPPSAGSGLGLLFPSPAPGGEASPFLFANMCTQGRKSPRQNCFSCVSQISICCLSILTLSAVCFLFYFPGDPSWTRRRRSEARFRSKCLEMFLLSSCCEHLLGFHREECDITRPPCDSSPFTALEVCVRARHGAYLGVRSLAANRMCVLLLLGEAPRNIL